MFNILNNHLAGILIMSFIYFNLHNVNIAFFMLAVLKLSTKSRYRINNYQSTLRTFRKKYVAKDFERKAS